MYRFGMIVSILVLAKPVAAQEILQWKFEAGERFRIEAVEKHKQKLFAAGKMTESQHTVTTVVSVRVNKIEVDGTAVELKIESVKVDAARPDSADGEMAKLMAGASFQAVITPQGQFVSFAGFDEFVRKLAAARGTPERLLRTLITEQGVKKGLGDYFAFLPPAAVAKGDTWQRAGLIPLGPLGSFEALNKYTYEGQRGKAAAINYVSSLNYVPPLNGSDVFKVVKGELQARSATGNYLFDADKGRLTQGDRRLILHGDLRIEVAGNQVAMTFELDQKTNIQVLDAP